MSIDQIFADPVSKKRKQTFNNHEQSSKRSKFNNGKAGKPIKSFSIEQNNKFQQRLKNLINNPTNKKTSFKSIGICRELCIATRKMKWLKPTKIQQECIPHILLGKDVIALAETGSGKT
eukprot:358049_1